MKPHLKSRTLWVNGIAGALLIAQQVAPILPPPVAATVAASLPFANMILRLLTTQPLGKAP